MRKKLKILITAGPTIENIDPVRYISNRSTGEMGYALATEAVKRKHAVTLISGPVSLKPPLGTRVINIETAAGLEKHISREIKKADCLIMSSAVCDFKPAGFLQKKLKSGKALTLKLVPNRDILKRISKIKYQKAKILVGFSLETGNALKSAMSKLRSKSLDLIISNRIYRHNDPFGKGRKEFLILDRNGYRKTFKNKTKREAARAILDSVEELVLYSEITLF